MDPVLDPLAEMPSFVAATIEHLEYLLDVVPIFRIRVLFFTADPGKSEARA
jgi:hypothetical protein